MTENEEKNQASLPLAKDDLPIGRDTEFNGISRSSADLRHQEKHVRCDTSGHQEENCMRKYEEIRIATPAGVFVQREENGVLTAEWKNYKPNKNK